jgi:outer membrane protein assembly factor BamB
MATVCAALLLSRTLCGGPTTAAEASWPTFRYGPARCGVVGSNTALPGPKLRWKFCEAQLLERRPFACSPAIAGARIVIGGDSYKVYCLDARTGKPIWTFDTRWPVFSSPAVWEGRVYIGEGLHEHTDCKLYCLDLATGKPLWSVQTKGHTESSPTVADGRLYFGAGDDGLYCADPVTGRIHWQHKGPHVDCCPLVADGRVYVGSGYRFQGVICLSARDGSPLWKRALPAPIWAAPSYADGRLFVAIAKGTFTERAERPYGEVRCLSPKTGNDVWRFTGVREGVLTSVAVCGGHAVFGSRDGACYALDVATGTLRWRTEIGSPVLSSPAVALARRQGSARAGAGAPAGHVLFGANDGNFTCLRLEDGTKAWSLDTSDDVLVFVPDPRIQSSPAVANGIVVFGSSNGHVYCLEGDRR